MVLLFAKPVQGLNGRAMSSKKQQTSKEYFRLIITEDLIEV